MAPLFQQQQNVSGDIGIAPPTNFFNSLRSNPWGAMDQAFNYQNNVNTATNQQMATQQNRAQAVPGQISQAYEQSPILQKFRSTLANRLSNPGMRESAVSRMRSRQVSQGAAQTDASARRANYSAARGGITGAAAANLTAQARARGGVQANRTEADFDIAVERERMADEAQSMGMASQFELAQNQQRQNLGRMAMEQYNQWQPHTNADGLSAAAQAAMYNSGLGDSGAGAGSAAGASPGAATDTAGADAGAGAGGQSRNYSMITQDRNGNWYAATGRGEPNYDIPVNADGSPRTAEAQNPFGPGQPQPFGFQYTRAARRY